MHWETTLDPGWEQIWLGSERLSNLSRIDTETCLAFNDESSIPSRQIRLRAIWPTAFNQTDSLVHLPDHNQQNNQQRIEIFHSKGLSFHNTTHEKFCSFNEIATTDHPRNNEDTLLRADDESTTSDYSNSLPTHQKDPLPNPQKNTKKTSTSEFR